MREAEALRAAYDGVTAAITPLSPMELLGPTRCHGWTVADVVHHLTADAQRALVALATPADGPPTRTHVTYWSVERPAEPDWAAAERAAAASAWAGRRAASVAREPGLLVTLWEETSAAAVHAAAAASPDALIATQGHVLTVPDLLTTLATEAVIHHLDLLAGLPPAPGPAVATLDGLLALHGGDAAARPPDWDVEDYLLKGAGRLALTAADRTALGPAAGLFPLLG